MPSSFFARTTGANVWKTVTGVSSAGSKRGRGKGTGKVHVKDFNLGQEIGIGRKQLLLGGLNSPTSVSGGIPTIKELGENAEYQGKLEESRKRVFSYRKYRDMPVDRGWSGRRAHGKSAGQPDEHNETSFDGFHSTVLTLRPMLRKTGVLGTQRRMNALVVTGNGNGLAGFADATGTDGSAVVRHARNRAAQQLVRIERWDDHTVMHDFFSRYYQTTVFVWRKPRGYGLRCHRIVRAICEAFGIKDLYAKVEGSTTNQINLTKAFFLGLMNQRSYQEMADEKRLHLVELRKENFNYPTILASPTSPVLSDDEIKLSGQNLDFTYFIYDGKIKQVKAKPRSPFEDDENWYKHLRRLDYVKNRETTKLLLAAKYGDRPVSDVFPYFKSNAASFNRPLDDD